MAKAKARSETPTNTARVKKLYQRILALSPEEQNDLYLRLNHAKGTAFRTNGLKLLGDFTELLIKYLKLTEELRTKLKRHRRPTRNAARDAEIMRLHSEGKSAGQTVKQLQGRYRLTDKMVTAVISRERRKPSTR